MRLPRWRQCHRRPSHRSSPGRATTTPSRRSSRSRDSRCSRCRACGILRWASNLHNRLGLAVVVEVREDSREVAVVRWVGSGSRMPGSALVDAHCSLCEPPRPGIFVQHSTASVGVQGVGVVPFAQVKREVLLILFAAWLAALPEGRTFRSNPSINHQIFRCMTASLAHYCTLDGRLGSNGAKFWRHHQ